MLRWGYVWIGFLVFSFSAEAYLPPLRSLIENIFDQRKSSLPIEAVLKHRIQMENNVVLQLDERIVKDRNDLYVLWSFPSLSYPIAARWKNLSYDVNNDTRFQSRSGLMLSFLMESSPEPFIRQLLAEQFIQADQFKQFSAEYKPEGDPKTWETSKFYVRHKGICLHRIKDKVMIAVTGINEVANTKTVFFNEASKKLARLEWREGEVLQGAWIFSQYGKADIPGQYSKRLIFENALGENVTSTLVLLRKLDPKKTAEFHSAFQGALLRSPLPAEIHQALKLLTNYR